MGTATLIVITVLSVTTLLIVNTVPSTIITHRTAERAARPAASMDTPAPTSIAARIPT